MSNDPGPLLRKEDISRSEMSSLIDTIYNLKGNFTPEFICILSALLGQEWTSPTITLLNKDKNNIIWGNLKDPLYPDTALFRYNEILACFYELEARKFVTNREADCLRCLAMCIPERFEVDLTLLASLAVLEKRQS